MIFRPDIKPPMWGPPDAVEYAVRANADRIGYGSLVKVCMPFWEQGGLSLDNIVTRNPFSATVGTTFEPSGCLFNGTDSAQVTDSSLLLGLNTTIIANVIQKSSTLAARILCTSNSSSSGYRGLMLYSLATTGEVNLLLGGSLGTFAVDNRRNTHISNNYVTKDKSTSIIATPTTFTGAANIWVDGNKCTTTTSGTASTFSAGTAPSVIGAVNTGSWAYSDCVIENLIVINKNLTANEAAFFYATPYALLMPVSRPVYFDLGSGGTTSSADPGNIAITGSSATGVKTSVSSANSGTVSIAGSVASGIRSLVSLATAASIAIAGFSAEGVYTPTGSTVSSAVAGIVAVSGAPATGVQTHIASTDPGTIAIVGNDATAATGYASTAGSGTVAITGEDATSTKTYVATASPTSIAITGSPAYATKSGGSSTSSGISLIFGKVILHL